MKRLSVTLIGGSVFVAALLMAGPGSHVNGAQTGKREVTFNQHVAPIFYKHCAECHRSGEIGPMSLLTYKEARPWAKSIREKVISREMPPWHADPSHGQFHNDRRLSQAEVEAVAAWVEGGAKEGEAKDLPPAPQFIAGWNIGRPDETFAIPEQAVPAEGVVKYQYFSVPTNFKEDRWVTAAEIRSTGRSVVHHVIVFVQQPESTSREGRLLAGVAPGEQPTRFLPGYGKKVAAGSKLIFQVHYTPNGKEATDVTTIGLKYAKEPVKHEVLTRPIMQTKFAIPPGEANYEVRSAYTFGETVRVYSFMPHMHLRGKDFEYKAVFPDGSSKILLSVPKYSFNWQTIYAPREPVLIPKGTRIECVAHFDNSANNKFNPDPTKEVRWGDQTWEEMMIGWVTFFRDGEEPPKPATTVTGPGPGNGK